MNDAVLFDTVAQEGAVVLELLAGKDKALVVRRRALFILHKHLQHGHRRRCDGGEVGERDGRVRGSFCEIFFAPIILYE